MSQATAAASLGMRITSHGVLARVATCPRPRVATGEATRRAREARRATGALTHAHRVAAQPVAGFLALIEESVPCRSVRRLKDDGLGATEIARRLSIGRASVHRILSTGFS
jgi:hypothetical protein